MVEDQDRVNSVLFAYGGRVEQSPSGTFYGNELNDSIVERFLNLGRSVTFVVRKRLIQEQQSKELLPFLSQALTIVTVPDYSGILAYFYKRAECKKIIDKSVSGCDILIARLPSSVGYWAIDAAQRYAKPYMVEVVGCAWDALWNHSLLGKMMAPYSYFKLKKYVWRAPFTMYVTRFFLQRRYRSKHCNVGISDVILPSLDTRVLERRLLKIADRQKQKHLVIGTLGGLDVKYKGHDTVLEAICILKAKGWNITYKVAGKGTGVDLIRKANKLSISDTLEIAGQLPYIKVFDFLDDLDVYIQPSKQEGMPRSLIEAMSRGCPCIGTSVGGIPELLQTDYCFLPGRYNELATILEKLDNTSLSLMASNNFLEAKKYEESILRKRRDDFYGQFLRSF